MSQWVYTILLPFEITFLILISIYTWRHPRTSGARVCAIVAALMIVWLVGDFLSRIGTTFDAQLWGERIKYIGVVSVPVMLLIFSWSYQGKIISRSRIVLMFVIPVMTLIIVWNPQWHHWFWKTLEANPPGPMKATFGIYFWAIHTPYSYLILLTTLVQLLKEAFNSPQYFRNRTLLLAAAICGPVVANIAYISGLTGGVSYTALSFVLFAIVFAFGLFRHRLIKSNPIAYETVFQTINDSVIVLDSDNLVTDLNPAAALVFERSPKELIGQPAKIAFETFPDLYASYEKVLEARKELTVETKCGTRYANLTISPLYSQSKMLIGRVITIQDITERKLHQQAIFAQELLAIQEAFAQQLIQSQENERHRIATELHDGLGQNLLVIKNRALIGATNSQEVQAKDQFDEINTLVAATLSEIRTISHNLRPPHLDRLGLTAIIEEMIEKAAAATGLHVDTQIVSLVGVFSKNDEIHVFRITQECLNNIIKHAQATQAGILIERTTTEILLTFDDNGKGFDSSTGATRTGSGLLNITERVRMLNGKLQINSSVGRGTTISIRLALP
jgi:PAS domain S-box-containing protein